jgi:DNA-binding transcriptional LysR family regulator
MHSLTHIAVFMRVVETGSFTAAARKLGMSKPTVSKHITTLERHLGARLLNRTTRSLGLTEIGAGFYSHCQNIMAEVATAEAEVLQSSGTPRGRLRISAPVCFGDRCMVPKLPEFLERYPDIEIDLSLSNRQVDLIKEGYDLAIRVTRNEPAGLISTHLAPCTHLVCAAPAYLERHGRPRNLAALAKHNCLLYAFFGSGNSWHLDGPNGPATVKVRGRFQANNGDALRLALLSGQGIGLMPTYLVSEDLAAGRLTDVLPGYRETSYAVLAVYPEEGRDLPKVQALVEHLRACFALSSEAKGFPAARPAPVALTG